MNIVDELNNEFSKQKSLYKVGQQPVAELEKYKQIPWGMRRWKMRYLC